MAMRLRARHERLAREANAAGEIVGHHAERPTHVKSLRPGGRRASCTTIDGKHRLESALGKQRVTAEGGLPVVVHRPSPFPPNAGLQLFLHILLRQSRRQKLIVHENVQPPVGDHRRHIVRGHLAVGRVHNPRERIAPGNRPRRDDHREQPGTKAMCISKTSHRHRH